MKRTIFIAVLALATVFSFTSCQKDKVKFYDFEISLDESGFAEGVPSPDSYLVTFTNTNTGEITELETSGKSVSVSQLIEGVYDVVATARYSIYNYLGSAKAVVIDSEDALSSIKISATKSSSLIFKEIFYCGSKTPAKTNYMKDNYFEIYNNGSEPVYVDGLCISSSSNYSSSAINFADNNGHLVAANGSSTTMVANDYVAVKDIIWQIPGDGKTYLLNPGESFIIASSATDHTAADKNPNSIDLSSAEFETVCDKYIENGQVDNPSSDNMILLNPQNATITKQYLVSVANAGLILFAPSSPVADATLIANYNGGKPSGTYVPILRSDVLDGVNWVKNSTTNPYLPENIDAGKTWVSGTYVKESIVRKEEGKSSEGNPIYQDTNNSTNDFTVAKDPSIRRNSKKASWAK